MAETKTTQAKTVKGTQVAKSAQVQQTALAPQVQFEGAVGPDLSVATSVSVDVRTGRSTSLVEPGQESQVLSFRGAEYHLPKRIVASPLPTLTFRHLEKVTVFAFAGKREKVQSAIQRAVASAIDTASLVKIACVAHSEGLHEDATTALVKAVKWAKKDQELKAIALSVASRLGYPIQ